MQIKVHIFVKESASTLLSDTYDYAYKHEAAIVWRQNNYPIELHL